MLLDLIQAEDDATRLVAAMQPRPCPVCIRLKLVNCLAVKPRGPFARLVIAQPDPEW